MLFALLGSVPACDARKEPKEAGNERADVETTEEKPTEPPPEGPAPETPPKFEPAAALAATLGAASVEKTDDGLGEVLDEVDHAAVFTAGGKRVGAAWYSVEVDGEPAVAMVHTQPLDELYEAIFTRSTVFMVDGGAWKPVGKAAFCEDDGTADYASLPTVLDLGGGHHALVHAPSITGCGAEDCQPSDDYVESTVHEVTAKGLVERARFEGPGCHAAEGPPDMAGCTVHVEGGDDDERGTLVFATKDSPSKPLKKHVYEFSGEAYAKG